MLNKTLSSYYSTVIAKLQTMKTSGCVLSSNWFPDMVREPALIGFACVSDLGLRYH